MMFCTGLFCYPQEHKATNMKQSKERLSWEKQIGWKDSKHFLRTSKW